MLNKSKPLILELNVIQNKQLNESFLRMFGGLIKTLMQRMFGMPTPPITIRGTEGQIEALKDALSYEKKYMTAFHTYGLDNPQTYRSKAELDKATSSFEKATGLVWPFK